jgi:drug/metabolite transporter (DMT)-like permease
MEWVLLIVWLSIINGALGGQYILNWMGNQPKFVGNKEVGVSPGVMTWWRELSKLLWAVIAVIIEISRGKKMKYLWPGFLSLSTIIICAFTGVIENIGFFYLPRYYSPHIFVPYVNVYLVFLPFLGKFLFNATIRKEHWIGVILVVIGLSVPYFPRIIGAQTDPKAILDTTAVIWIIIINMCLCSQQILNNKTVQTVLPNVGANALVVWREIWKMLFISIALFTFPLIGNMMRVNIPDTIPTTVLETQVYPKLDDSKRAFLSNYYEKSNDQYTLKKGLSQDVETNIKQIFKSAEYNRFFALFDGNIFPKNWWPILFVVLAGLSGYIYSFGFFKLAKFAAHFWVPYTNVYLAVIPFIMFLFGQHVTTYQIIGSAVTTIGLMVGVSYYKRHKVDEIEKTYKESDTQEGKAEYTESMK